VLEDRLREGLAEDDGERDVGERPHLSEAHRPDDERHQRGAGDDGQVRPDQAGADQAVLAFEQL
jgi:hypothetical protein